MKFPNRNQIMIIIGLVVAEGPDVAAVAAWLGGLGIPHLAKLIHLLGWLSTALASAAIAWPSIRSKLALAGLATPPGATAPWIPGRPGDPELSQPVDLPSSEKPTPIEGNPVARPQDKGSIEWVYILAVLAIAVLACASIVAFAPKAGL